jgi:hypothetical protein
MVGFKIIPVLSLIGLEAAAAFQTGPLGVGVTSCHNQNSIRRQQFTTAVYHSNDNNDNCEVLQDENGSPFQLQSRRKAFTSALATAFAALTTATSTSMAFAEDDAPPSAFAASLAEKAAKLSSQVDQEERASGTAFSEKESQALAAATERDGRTIYDFKVPVAGVDVSIEDLVTRKGSNGKRPKAILLVNIKQDDPIARRNIPELIALGAQ